MSDWRTLVRHASYLAHVNQMVQTLNKMSQIYTISLFCNSLNLKRKETGLSNYEINFISIRNWILYMEIKDNLARTELIPGVRD